VSESNFFFSEIQFNCIKKIILKFLKPFKSSYFFNVKPYFFLTSKPSESRMGGGKGNLSFKVFNIKEGQIFLSFRGVPSLFLFNLVSKLSYKLPNKFKLVKSKF
jgi:ribosomal protein L16/L10AE